MNIVEDALTFDDVLLLPDHSTVLPKEVSLRTRLTREITLNIPLLRGRDFSDSDQAGPVPVAIINQALAERGWPGQSAMGGKFRLGNDGPVFEVIGVVGNTQYRPQNEAPPPAFYLPLSQQFLPGLSLVVRTDGKPETLLAPLRQISKCRCATCWPSSGSAPMTPSGAPALTLCPAPTSSVRSAGSIWATRQHRRRRAFILN